MFRSTKVFFSKPKEIGLVLTVHIVSDFLFFYFFRVDSMRCINDVPHMNCFCQNLRQSKLAWASNGVQPSSNLVMALEVEYGMSATNFKHLFMTILQCLSLCLPNIGQMSSSQCQLLASTQTGSLQNDMSSTWPFRSVGVSLLLQSSCRWPLLFPSTFPNILDFKESD